MYPGQVPAQRMMAQPAAPQQMPATPVGGIASLMPQQMAPVAQAQMPYMVTPVMGMADGGRVGSSVQPSPDMMQLSTVMRTGTPEERMAALNAMRSMAFGGGDIRGALSRFGGKGQQTSSIRPQSSSPMSGKGQRTTSSIPQESRSPIMDFLRRDQAGR